MAGAGFREPTREERAFFAVLILADFPGNDAVAQQLAGVRVRDLQCAALGSLEILPAEAAPALPAGHAPTLLDLQGADAAGHRFTVSLHAAAGRLTRLDILPAGPHPLGSIDLATLTQLDAVPRGTLELFWLVPRPAPILGASG
jgi:hypothetical protein